VHPAFRAFWHPVAWSRELGTALYPVTLLGEPLVALRDSAGQVRVFVDECPHRGAPISMGSHDGDELVCPFHGWRFGFDGAATCIPSLGPDAVIPSRARLGRPAAVCERYGIVWVALAEPACPILEWPDGGDPKLGEFSPTSHVSVVLAGYQCDNLLDASHFPFLHGSLSGRSARFEHYEVLYEHQYGFGTKVPFRMAADEVGLEGWFTYGCAAPFTVTLRNETADGQLRRSFFQAIQPIDEHHTRLFFIVRGHATEPAELAEQLRVEEIVQLEDLTMTASQRRRTMSLDDGVDLHVKSDRNGILYRRMLRRLVDGFESAQP
jgi:phenylpropionate dioxygenase-like ring-hydroxylating dioxygenase large terminal subunit